MRRVDADIDIDVPNRDAALASLGKYVNASQINGDVIKKHNVGVYLQDIPAYLDTNLSSLDYRQAPEYGFFKIDILTNTVYDSISSEEELDVLIDHEPDWSLLLDENIVGKLAQIHHYPQMLKKWKPTSIDELAMFIAMIRPSKAYLMNKNNWSEVVGEIWTVPGDKSPYFKKSHAIAYAVSIAVQLNLISLDRL